VVLKRVGIFHKLMISHFLWNWLRSFFTLLYRKHVPFTCQSAESSVENAVFCGWFLQFYQFRKMTRGQVTWGQGQQFTILSFRGHSIILKEQTSKEIHNTKGTNVQRNGRRIRRLATAMENDPLRTHLASMLTFQAPKSPGIKCIVKPS
jgi:hypothetical protein